MGKNSQKRRAAKKAKAAEKARVAKRSQFNPSGLNKESSFVDALMAARQANADVPPQIDTSSGFRQYGMSVGFDPEHEPHGLPSKVSREWLEKRSDAGEFGAVRLASLGVERDDVTHAIYSFVCNNETHDDMNDPCENDPEAEWELVEYEG